MKSNTRNLLGKLVLKELLDDLYFHKSMNILHLYIMKTDIKMRLKSISLKSRGL